MRWPTPVALALAVTLSAAALSCGGTVPVYKYTTPDGATHFGSDPPADATILEKVGEVERRSPVIENLFVVNFLSVAPILVDGVVEVAAMPPFVRGDANGDLRLNFLDPIFQLAVMFQELPGPDCRKSFDGNDDGSVTIADPVYVLNYLFREGPEPPAPFPEPGIDLTPDDVECELILP